MQFGIQTDRQQSVQQNPQEAVIRSLAGRQAAPQVLLRIHRVLQSVFLQTQHSMLSGRKIRLHHILLTTMQTVVLFPRQAQQ